MCSKHLKNTDLVQSCLAASDACQRFSAFIPVKVSIQEYLY